MHQAPQKCDAGVLPAFVCRDAAAPKAATNAVGRAQYATEALGRG
jgi:hypothetical protein